MSNGSLSIVSWGLVMGLTEDKNLRTLGVAEACGVYQLFQMTLIQVRDSSSYMLLAWTPGLEGLLS